MNRKTALTLLISIIVISIMVVGFFLFFQKQSTQQNSVVDAARNFFGGFFPSSPTSENSPGNINGETPGEINNIIPRLRQISSFPVAGGVMFERKATSSSLLIQEETNKEINSTTTQVVYRFVERTTGHVYETTSRNLSQKRITNTTIPKIYEAYFSNDGENLTMLYLNPKVIETFVGKINYPQTSTSTEIKEEDLFAKVTGSFLPSESFSFTKSQFSNEYAFLNTSDSFGEVEITNLYTGNIKTPLENKKIFNLNTSEWKIQYLKDGTLALNTKASVVSEGFLYFLNPKDGILKKRLGNTLGLTSLVSPDGKKIFYSYYDSGSTKTVVYDSETKTYTSLDLATIVGDKCVWSQTDNVTVYCALPLNLVRGDFPDSWYQGKYAFNDSFVKINTKDFTIETLMSANTETAINLDAIDLQLSPSEDYLMFINKDDLILWSLDIL
jgi:hypothetical protein